VNPSERFFSAIFGLSSLARRFHLLNLLIRHIPALEASLLSMLEPILNPIWVMLFVGEIPSLNALIGGSVIIGAVALQNIVSARQAVRN